MCDELAREVREKGKGLESRVSHLYPSTQVYGPDAAVRSWAKSDQEKQIWAKTFGPSFRANLSTAGGTQWCPVVQLGARECGADGLWVTSPPHAHYPVTHTKLQATTSLVSAKHQATT